MFLIKPVVELAVVVVVVVVVTMRLE